MGWNTSVTFSSTFMICIGAGKVCNCRHPRHSGHTFLSSHPRKVLVA